MTSANVSVDLDPLRCYASIHDLPLGSSPRPSEDPIYRAIPRFRALFQALGVPATFFVVARDLDDPVFAETIRELARDGHEIASHSLDHFYDLVLRKRAVLEEQVEGAARRLAAVTGVRPRGFRAPGYHVTDELLEVVAGSGAGYDASVFPCPVYWAGRASVIAAMRVVGRRSASLVGSVASLRAPVEPYRIGRPYETRGAGLLEIPIGVTPIARLPLIGTALCLAGPAASRWIARAMAPRRFASLELHAIDLCDATDEGLGRLAGRQTDLRVPRIRKERALRATLDELSAQGRRFCRLDQMAERDHTVALV